MALKSTRAMFLKIECQVDSEEQLAKLRRALTIQFRFGQTCWLIPPWDPTRKLTAEQLNHRAVLAELIANDAEFYRSDQYQKLGDRQNEQLRDEGLSDEDAAAARTEFRDAVAQFRTEIAKALLNDDPTRQTMVDLFIEKINFEMMDTTADEDYERWDQGVTRWNEQIGKLLGQLPIDGEMEIPTSYDTRYAVSLGSFESIDDSPKITQLAFYNPPDGLHAMLGWLRTKGCDGFSIRAANPAFLFREKFEAMVEGVQDE